MSCSREDQRAYERYGVQTPCMKGLDGASGAPEEPPVAPVAPLPVLGTTEARLGVTWASEVEPQIARWVWRGRVPASELTLVVGRGGLGKTIAVGADFAARLSRGDLDGDHDGPTNVLIASAEDSPEHTLVPRLMAADADLTRVGFVPPDLEIPADVQALGEIIRASEATALILDPLNAYLGFQIDSHNDKDLRVALGPLSKMAHETECTVIAVGHVNKLRSSDAYAMVSGSIGYYNAARSVLVVVPDPEAEEEDPSSRVLVHAKSNLSALAPPLRFRVTVLSVETAAGVTDVGAVEWGEEAPHLSADDALGGVDEEDRTNTDVAAEWLRSRLEGGPKLRKALLEEASRERPALPLRTLQRAARRLGVRMQRQGFGEPSTWELPESSQATVVPSARGGATGATDASTSQIESAEDDGLDHLGRLGMTSENGAREKPDGQVVNDKGNTPSADDLLSLAEHSGWPKTAVVGGFILAGERYWKAFASSASSEGRREARRALEEVSR